jgi:pimeloyl-ACP methyl ester carboxylesterase
MSTQATQDRSLAREGARLRWRLEGDGPPLVLLHGWALDLEYWNPLVAQLAPHFTLLRFDRSGFGLSEGEPAVMRNVADLAALLETAQLDRVVLVGMSQGARLALHFACRHPAMVRGLVLDGAPALDAEPEIPVFEYRQLLAQHGIEALRTAVRAHPLMRLQREDPAMRRLLDDILTRYRGLDLLHPSERPPPPQFAALDMPVMLLNGRLDSQDRREASLRLQAGMRHARLVELQDAGHLALLDDPAGYATELQAFAAGLAPWTSPRRQVLQPGIRR